jgi:hypothetical protein
MLLERVTSGNNDHKLNNKFINKNKSWNNRFIYDIYNEDDKIGKK